MTEPLSITITNVPGGYSVEGQTFETFFEAMMYIWDLFFEYGKEQAESREV